MVAGVFAASVTSPAPAQEGRIGGGVAFPMQPSEFTDLYDVGFHGGVELGGRLGKQKKSELRRTFIGGAVYHHRFPLDTQGVVDRWRAAGMPPDTEYSIDGGTYVLTEVFVSLRHDLGTGPVRPFLLAGAGMGFSDITRLEVTLDGKSDSVETSGENDPMLTLGLGADIPVGGSLRVFAQARVSLVTTKGDNTLLAPITAGIAF